MHTAGSRRLRQNTSSQRAPFESLRKISRILTKKQSETLRNIRNLETNGQRRFIYDREAQELSHLGLVEKQPGIGPSYCLTAYGWKALELAEERLSELVML